MCRLKEGQINTRCAGRKNIKGCPQYQRSVRTNGSFLTLQFPDILPYTLARAHSTCHPLHFLFLTGQRKKNLGREIMSREVAGGGRTVSKCHLGICKYTNMVLANGRRTPEKMPREGSVWG